MRIRHTSKNVGEAIELQMTPMIDIVFLLLIFFVMTFKIVAPEGDFNIKMPLAAPSSGVPDDAPPPILVRLLADADGNLANIVFGERSLGRDFQQLRVKILAMVGDDPNSALLQDTEVELDCDYRLKYENVVEAMTAVSGYIDDNGRIVKVVEKVKFAPPRPEE